MGTRRSSPGVKRPGIENHSPPCSAEVKNAWTSTPQYAFYLYLRKGWNITAIS
jgi:hypothetical protein